MSRRAAVERATAETRILIELDLDAHLDGQLETDHPFLTHMLDQVRRHGRLGLVVQARGDVQIDPHHLAEDTGITLGQALARALGDKVGIERYGSAFAPMDETLAHAVLDLSGRPHLAFEPEAIGVHGDANGFNIYHLREFLRGLTNHASATLHLRVLAGREAHHVIEASFKAVALALRQATRRSHDELPSTKGSL